MFTGIIETLGKIISVEPRQGDLRLTVEAEGMNVSELRLGDSIAVNGVCLTVIVIDGKHLSFDVSVESIERTSLKQIKAGDQVNLEPALTLNKSLGGHMVSGHVDGVGEVVKIEPDARSKRFWIACPARLKKYMAAKGSVCLDGVSLTINEVTPQGALSVNIVPHTLESTTLQYWQVGTSMNIEVDIIARYLETLLESPVGKYPCN